MTSPGESRSINQVWVAIAVAIIGAAGVITAAYVGRDDPAEPATNGPATPSPIPPVKSNEAWTLEIKVFDGVEMVLVPPGCFMMGSTDEQIESVIERCLAVTESAESCPRSVFENEAPQQRVCFEDPFWIDRTEVTNAQYGSSGEFSCSNCPREMVTWFEAKEFCRSRGARLPTEAEWEYAARGPDGWLYPWGDTFVPANVVSNYNSGGRVSEVGSKLGGASWVGALDMSGNVWEWTSTISQRYPYDSSDGRENLSDNTSGRVPRGGDWDAYDFNLHATRRGLNLPTDKSSILGFRCVRSYD